MNERIQAPAELSAKLQERTRRMSNFQPRHSSRLPACGLSPVDTSLASCWVLGSIRLPKSRFWGSSTEFSWQRSEPRNIDIIRNGGQHKTIDSITVLHKLMTCLHLEHSVQF